MEAFISQTRVSYEYPSEIIYERKLDTALRNTFLESFEYRYHNQQLNIKDNILLNWYNKHCHKEPWLKDNTYLSYIFQSILSPSYKLPSSSKARHNNEKLIDTINQITQIQISNMLKNYDVSNQRILHQKIHSYLTSLDTPIEVQNALHLCSWLSSTIDSSARLRRRQGKMTTETYIEYLTKYSHYYYEPLKMTVVYGDNICLVKLQGKLWVVPHACIIMMHNKLADCISVLMFSTYNAGVSLPDDCYSITVHFIRELAYLLNVYGNTFYTISKSLESLCIAESIVEFEQWENTEFLKTTSEDIFEDTGFDYMSSNLRQYIISCTTPLRHQLCCLTKLLGHPYVDMEKGAKKLHKNTTEIYELNLLTINQSINHIKLNYIRNHIMKFKKWPTATISFGCPKGLEQAFVRNKDPYDPYITKKYGKIQIDDLNYVEIGVNDKFYVLENVIPYLKDKTISILRSKVLYNYLQQADQLPTDRVRWEDTRMLLAYLLHPKLDHDHITYIQNYEDSITLDDLKDYLILRIVPKEKELKIDFRGFGCKTYEDRFRGVAQELNSMRFLDDYSDEQAMTLSELEILKRLYTFRNLYKAYPAHKIIYINIDAKNWNNHFRKETVDTPMQETLNKIYGTSIFGKTHLAFEKAYFHVPGYPTSYSWNGQGGGIEGQNQDTWVIIYLGQIKAAMQDLGYKYHCLCKGDDLRLAVAVPPHIWKHQEMSLIKNNIVTRLSLKMEDFGHKIKVLESYGSSEYFCFSKNASIGLVELPQGYRKIQKCYGASNAMIATLDEYIGSTFSNAHSTCKVEPNVLPSYLVGLFWSIQYLLNHPIYADCTTNELTALLLVPSMCGGFPIIYLHNMAVRAESDLLSPFLELFNYCRTYYPQVAYCISNFLYAPIHNSDEKYTMLYKDPYSIPHDRPPIPSAVLRRYIIPILKKYARHEDIIELISATESNDMDQIHKILSSPVHINAKIIGALYASTPEGILQELTRKFESARSINELMVRTVGYRRSVKNLRMVVKSEKVLQSWRKNRLKGCNIRHLESYEHLITECPAESAHNIRKYLWGKEISGITMPPMQHQVYIMNAFTNINSYWVNQNHFTYTIEQGENSVDKDNTDHYKSGNYKPFVGYTTRNGMTEPTVHFIEKDPMLTKVKNLLDLVTWTNKTKTYPDGTTVTSNCPDLIRIILRSYTNTDISELAPFSGVRRSGTIQHHVRAPSFRESIVPNVLSNCYTRVQGESNTHTRYRNSKDHYYVNFLHIYCYSVWISQFELEFHNRNTIPEKIWVVTTPCEFCNRVIEDEPLVFDLSYGQGITLHPLAVSHIGQIAENIMKASLEAASDKRANIDVRDLTELHMDVAYQGILQEVLEQTYRSRITLQTRYELPTINDEGYNVLVNLIPHNSSRDIGQSELKRIPLSKIIDYVAVIITHYASRVKKRGLLDDSNSVLSITPAESLPWYGLLCQVHKAGKLPQLILSISKTIGLPHASCYYNPATASKFLARYASIFSKYVIQGQRIIILSYYSSSQITYELELNISSGIRRQLHQYITKFMPKDGISLRLLTTDQKEALLDLFHECCVYLAVLHNIDIISDEISQLIEEHKYQKITCYGLDHISPMMISDLLEEEEEIPIYITDWFTRWEQLGILKEDVDLQIDWDYIIDKLQQRHRRDNIEIHYTNVGTCCLAVRSYQHVHEDSDDPVTFLPFTQLPLDPEILIRPVFKRPVKYLEGREYILPAIPVNLDCTLETVQADPISLHNLWCLYGAVSGSESILTQMLTRLDNIRSDINVQATCLADGYGGFMSTLYGFYGRNVKFIYHTLQEDINSAIISPNMELTHERHPYTTIHLDEGYTDLNLWSTFERILQYNMCCDYVTCDIELSTNNLYQQRTIMYNVFKYYLMTRTRNCITILKFDMRNPTDIAKFIDISSYFCVHTYIHSPLANNSKQYVYLVGIGWRKSYDSQHLEYIYNNYISDTAIPMVVSYYKQVQRQLNYHTRIIKDELPINDIESEVTDADFTKMYINPRLPNLLTTDFDFKIVLLDDDEISNFQPWKERIWNIIMSDQEVSLRDLDNYLGVNTYKYITTLRDNLTKLDDTQTAAHRHVILCRLFKIVGYRAVVGSFHNITTPVVISERTLNETLIELYDSLETRDKRLPPNYINIYNTDIEHEGMMVRYLSCYRRGIDIGLVLLGDILSRVNSADGRHKLQQKREEAFQRDHM